MLIELGAGGERVVYVMRNSSEMVIGLYAGMAARAQVAPLNPAYTDIDPRLIVCDIEFAGRGKRLGQLGGGAKIIVLGADGMTIEQLLSAPPTALPRRSPTISAPFSSPAAPPAFPRAPIIATAT
jgi:hypothetical protein